MTDVSPVNNSDSDSEEVCRDGQNFYTITTKCDRLACVKI